ncbi:MAG: helix-turn-helix domain-containing protein [Actinobacteria bacterium]|nr:helix-turn-helix domain-containing protein [Actinomycetota bacterium]MBO0787227.1 helix-turn-helix domain-containing protein [Actinomycetota bacterium]
MAKFRQPEAFEAAGSALFAPVRLETPADQPFHAEVAGAVVGPLVVARVACTTGRCRRQPRLIGSADRELVKVVVHRDGDLIVGQDGRQTRVMPGDMFACETIRPYELVSRDSCDMVMVGVPRPMLSPVGDLISSRTAVRLPGDCGIRSLIGSFFSGLAEHADGLGGAGSVRLADAMVSLLIAAFAGMPAARVELPTGLADRIMSYALASLHDPGLSVGSVAHRFGISPRYLHKLMQERGIRFGVWVRRERMKRIRLDLLDPRLAHWTAARIAARWGIRDPDHLSRALRAEFGQSAAEIRGSALPPADPGH